MKKAAVIVVLIVLTAVVLHSAFRIEVLNVQAGNYLPRRDHVEGTPSDGKWRASGEDTPRDRLREAVQTFGLAQYVFAPLLLVLALIVLMKARKSWAGTIAACCGFFAVIAIGLMLYRGYYPSLGW